MIDATTPEYQAFYAAEQTRKRERATGLYPWDAWFDGRYHLSVAGEDYRVDIHPESFRTQICNRARKQKLQVGSRVFLGMPRRFEFPCVLFKILTGPDDKFVWQEGVWYFVDRIRPDYLPTFERTMLSFKPAGVALPGDV